MVSLGFLKCKLDNCVYLWRVLDHHVVLYLHDDILIIGKDKKYFDDLKDKLNKEFKMKGMGDPKKILVIKITRKRTKKY